MKRFILSLLIGLCAVSVQADTFTDSLGRSVPVPASPQRVVSLAPALTELLFALGLQKQLVGVTRQCDYPTEAKTIASIGEYHAPNLEAIVSVTPDLVLMDAAGGSPQLSERLQSIGIPVYVVETGGLSQAVHVFRQVGALVGAESKGEWLAQRLTEQLKLAETLPNATSVVFCVSLQPLVVAAPDTIPGEMLDHLGATNMVPLGHRRYPQWTLEALIEADPQLILVADMAGQDQRKDFFKRLPVLQAVRNKRVFVLNPDLVFRPGPRLGEGLQQVQKALRDGAENGP